jgi:uncharacterized OsmC-like protein
VTDPPAADIGSAVANARAYLRDHPDEARYTDSPATARIESGLRILVTGPEGAVMATDGPPSIGGGGSAPSPGWQMRAAHAACVAMLLAIRAAELGLVLTDAEVTIDSESDDRGILDAAPDAPVGPLATRMRIRLRANGHDEATLAELAEWAWRHCPVDDAVRRAVPVSVETDLGTT